MASARASAWRACCSRRSRFARSSACSARARCSSAAVAASSRRRAASASCLALPRPRRRPAARRPRGRPRRPAACVSSATRSGAGPAPPRSLARSSSTSAAASARSRLGAVVRGLAVGVDGRLLETALAREIVAGRARTRRPPSACPPACRRCRRRCAHFSRPSGATTRRGRGSRGVARRYAGRVVELEPHAGAPVLARDAPAARQLLDEVQPEAADVAPRCPARSAAARGPARRR